MCAWSTPSSRTTGDIITAAIWNQDVVNNPNYLKGTVGTVTIQDTIQLPASEGLYFDDTNHGIEYGANGTNIFYFREFGADWRFINSVAAVKFQIDGNGAKNAATSLYLLAGTGANRHVESGTSAAEAVAQGATNDDAFTFVNAFASNPAVADGMTHTGTGPSDDARVLIKTASLSTTGVTLQKYNNVSGGLTMTTYYIAEGAD